MTEGEVDRLLRTAPVGRLGLCRDDQPYIVPLNFAYEEGCIYFHCAEIGMKIDFLHDNSSVCFEADEYITTVKASMPCDHDTAYRSVILFGKATIVSDLKEKTAALRLIIEKYAGREHAEKLTPEAVDSYRSSDNSGTLVVKIMIEQKTGKSNKTGLPQEDSAEL